MEDKVEKIAQNVEDDRKENYQKEVEMEDRSRKLLICN